MNDVTIIIPVFDLKSDRWLNFRFVLDTILSVMKVPVLVVEQVRRDEPTPVSEYCKRMGVKYISKVFEGDQIHKSALMNFGVETATTEYVWINDGDSFQNFKYIMSEEWTHDFIQPFITSEKLDNARSKELRAGGDIEITTEDVEDVEDEKASPKHNFINLYGALSFIARKDAFIEIGGMDEAFVGWGYEDNEFCCRVFSDIPNFKIIKCIGLHLWHEPAIYNNKELAARNQVYFESKLSNIELTQTEKNIQAFLQDEPTLNILTMFRGNYEYLENIRYYLHREYFPCDVSITWVLNTPDQNFKECAAKYAEDFNDIRVITNMETLELTDNYYDFRHEYVSSKYADLLPNISDTFILTLEDDMIPPKGSLVKLYNSLYFEPTAGASSAIYKSKDEPELACCITKYSTERLPLSLLQNYGTVGGLRTGGGLTLWRNEAIEESFPVKFTRTSPTVVEGWDWYLSRKLIENGHKILLHTDIVCEHIS